MKTLKRIGHILLDDRLLIVHQGVYESNDHLAVIIKEEDDAPYTILSINIEDILLKEGEFVLNHDLLHNIFDPLRETLLNSELMEDTGIRAYYGFCRDIPIWRLK